MPDQLKEFLKPQSAVAFGGCAAMVIAFTTTFHNAFGWPAAIVALVLSGLFAVINVIYYVDKYYMKLLYWVICTMVIFHAAMGGNTTITNIPSNTPAPTTLQVWHKPDFSIVTTAYAESTNRIDHIYFLSITNDSGDLVYTNFVGKAITNDAGAIFKKWRWSFK